MICAPPLHIDQLGYKGRQRCKHVWWQEVQAEVPIESQVAVLAGKGDGRQRWCQRCR